MLALNQTSLPRVATKRLTRRKTCDTKEAPKLRAREKSLSVVSYRQKGRRPQCYTRAGRARARARARAKYPGHFGNKPKTSPIEQISYRWEPKNSTLQRVTLQSLKSCYRWSILLRESVSNLAPASAQNQPKI